MDENIVYFAYARKSSEDKNRQVQSVSDQLEWIEATARERGFTIAKTFIDEQSARKPGRLNFNAMMELIEKSIKPIVLVVWELNRLARNPIDEGNVRYAFMQGKIAKIITSKKDYNQDSDQTTFAIEFGKAADYSINLSKDVKRGMQGRVRNGWRPTMAPMGYKNDIYGLKGNKQIFPDEMTWDKWRKIWEFGLTGNYSVPQLIVMAHELGLRTRKGGPLALSTMYKIFDNPFYTGMIRWDGIIQQGLHKPMVTMNEFERMQDLLHAGNKKRDRVYENPYAGLIQCGECGGMITADSPKLKRNKGNGAVRIYHYLRCTKKKRGPKCSQQYLRREEMEAQVVEELGKVEIPEKLESLIFRQIEKKRKEENQSLLKRTSVLQREINELTAKKNVLMDKMLEGVIDNATYKMKESEYAQELMRFTQEHEKLKADQGEGLDSIKATFNFAKEAKNAFQKGGFRSKRAILRAYGSNLKFRDKKLYIQAVVPFQSIKRGIKKSELILEVLEPEKTRMQMRKNLLNEGLELIWSG